MSVVNLATVEQAFAKGHATFGADDELCAVTARRYMRFLEDAGNELAKRLYTCEHPADRSSTEPCEHCEAINKWEAIKKMLAAEPEPVSPEICCDHPDGLHRNGKCYGFECHGSCAAPETPSV